MEDIWWRQFFRELGRYKKQFLFLFQVEEWDIAAVEGWPGREYFILQNLRAGERRVFPTESITEKSLKRHLADCWKSSGIGIKMSKEK